MCLGIIILVLVGLITPLVHADTITFNNGVTINGVIVRRDKDSVRIKQYIGAGIVTTNYMTDEIDSIMMDDEANRDILNQYQSNIRTQQDKKVEQRKKGRDFLRNSWENQRKETEAQQAAAEAEARREQYRMQKQAEAMTWEERKLQKEFEREYEKEKESLRFGYIHERVNPDGWHIYAGEVFNDGVNVKKNIVIRMDFYDNKGDYLTTGRVNSEPSELAPGEKATFKIFVVNPDLKIARYEKLAAWDYEVDGT